MDEQRAAAFSQQLRQAHQRLRDQLARIRAGLGSPADTAPADTGPADTAPALPLHCLAFCSALTAHHQGEDSGLFTELLALRPDLEPAVAKLAEDHTLIAAIVRQVQALAEQAPTAPAENRPRLRRELDGLTAITESHFRYEERAIGAALDQGVPDTGWSRPVFRPADPAS